MARIPRLLINNEKSGDGTVYHVMSRTALDGFPMKDVEKDYLIGLITRFRAGNGDRSIIDLICTR